MAVLVTSLINGDYTQICMNEKQSTPWYVWLLLLIFAVLATTSMTHNSATSDEVTHITSGYSYLKYFDYTYNPEHPPLTKIWGALPLLIVNPVLADAPADFVGDQWDYAKNFLYHSGNDADQIYFWTRLMFVLVALLLGWYIWRWAFELFGWKGGLLALVLYVFDPNFLAHSTVVHTDVAISAAIFITTYYFWKMLGSEEKTFSWKHIAILGTLIGVGFAVKFTGIYVIGFLAILYILHLYYEKEYSNIIVFLKQIWKSPRGLWKGVAGLSLALLVGVVVLSATYGFVHFDQYITGFQNVIEQSTEGRPGYLLGMHDTQGWWYYFVVAFFVKTPVATIILLFASLYFVFSKKVERTQLRNYLFLLVPACLYFLAFVLSKYNIGLRHILPIYPFLFVFIGALTTVDLELLGKWKRWAKPTLLFFIATLIVATVFAYPYYISFFNVAVGGTDNGHKYLLDSNLDWGQGLKETAIWLEENGYKDSIIRMAYFGNEDPAYRGIRYKQLACVPTPGIQIISVNRLYDFLDNQYGCIDWLFDYKPRIIIAHSIFIYDIQDEVLIEKHGLCQQNCNEGCTSRGEQYGDSFYKSEEDGCLCICSEATNKDLGIV
jgi:hypothetical protein